MSNSTQKTRLFTFLFYLALLSGASKFAFDSWFPSIDQKGLWYFTGLCYIILGDLLLTPFFKKPVDILSYGFTAVCGMLAVFNQTYSDYLSIAWYLITCYICFCMLLALIVIATTKAKTDGENRINESLYEICVRIGTPSIIFTLVFLFSIFAFHSLDVKEWGILVLSWILIVYFRPFESIYEVLSKLWKVWKPQRKEYNHFGYIVQYEKPDIILISSDKFNMFNFGRILIHHDDISKICYSMLIDHIGYYDKPCYRAIVINKIQQPEELDVKLNFDESEVYLLDSTSVGNRFDQNDVYRNRENFIGIVSKDSNVAKLFFEIVCNDIDLHEGMLLEVMIGNKKVVYQIVNGITKEEILYQKNKLGYVLGEAKKIGHWDEKERRFERVHWVPQPNSPVLILRNDQPILTKDSIGYFPNSAYDVRLDMQKMVTHNTALLGILGVGKTYLACELIERAISQGVKVICLDITNQYTNLLDKYADIDLNDKFMNSLNQLGQEGKKNVSKNVEEGGSINSIREKVNVELSQFLDSSQQTKKLLVLNPSGFSAWKQDSKPFQGEASMASLTPTEITRIITESILYCLMEQGTTDYAKCWLVFEEAHSLIPEWNTIIAEGDKAASNGTAKAILQGRKYGLGCMVITQRTAHVTKSILNQCNTVFAMRIYDATGMDFLKNFVGDDYSSTLSSLEDRHAVFFGRGSSCHDPVLIKLNDREDFKRRFRGDGEVK